MNEHKIVYIVMDGNYESVFDSVFDNESDAKRRAAALHEGYYFPSVMNERRANDYPYRIDYYDGDDTVSAYLNDEVEPHEIKDLGDGFYRMCVRALTSEDAKRVGRAHFLQYLGKEDDGVTA